MKKKNDFLKRGFVAVSLLCGFLGIAGQSVAAYPDKPIKLIVSFPPGGPVDIAARIVGARLTDVLKQSVFVDNKTGAAGNVGTQQVAKSPNDGYTFLVTSSSYAVNPSLYGDKAGYSPKEFAPVIVIATQPNVVSVNEKVPVRTLAELRSLATKEKMAFSSPGSGTTPHLTCENLFHIIWKNDSTHIPYRGAGPASVAVVGGETPIGCTAVAGVFQFHKQGKVRILAVSSTERLADLPDIPTMAELGFPQIKDYTWVAVLAPVGTPPEIVNQMNLAIQKVIDEPDTKEKLQQAGLIPVGGSAQKTNMYINDELKHWSKVVIETKAKAE
ncbi:MFS transporter [Polynucleobacter sp. SHI8]|uniref:tripartite tricarboxylate transporter substrate binding protein n=1 Tax=unclassified Polynucleobacter TaxID=2640945 RepID=UPI0024911213|nr:MULTISPECIES: tripartite tricarboxylate transporter substrate binding protein [unclassified Polynucleobacter]BDW10061.1 MFS transporter [Polynucleobacter sp. SHI2]BDW12507.1 MFS transporter [Polynucleobacter sp. SHI8]